MRSVKVGQTWELDMQRVGGRKLYVVLEVEEYHNVAYLFNLDEGKRGSGTLTIMCNEEDSRWTLICDVEGETP